MSGKSFVQENYLFAKEISGNDIYTGPVLSMWAEAFGLSKSSVQVQVSQYRQANGIVARKGYHKTPGEVLDKARVMLPSLASAAAQSTAQGEIEVDLGLVSSDENLFQLVDLKLSDLFPSITQIEKELREVVAIAAQASPGYAEMQRQLKARDAEVGPLRAKIFDLESENLRLQEELERFRNLDQALQEHYATRRLIKA